MEVNNGTVGQAFKQRRRALGLTQSQVAERLGMTQSYVASVERSDRDLRWPTVVEMARALELEPMLVPREKIPAVEAAMSLNTDEEAPPLTGDAW